MKKNKFINIGFIIAILCIIGYYNVSAKYSAEATQCIDFPKAEVEGKKVTVSGWAMSTVTNDILVYIDNNKVNNVIRTERNDVLEVVKEYGNKLINPLPGYSAEYDVSNLKDGEHKATVKVLEKGTNNVLSEASNTFKLTKYKATQCIDFPKVEVEGKKIIISGWAMATTENDILVYIDDKQVNNVVRTERNDVLEVVKDSGNKDTTPLPGYSTEYEASTLKDGEHKITVKVIEKGTNNVLSETSNNFKLTKYKTTQYMDFPKSEVVGKKIIISGWTMATTENDVLIYVDDKQVNNVIRTERNDVLESVKGSGTQETNPLPGYKTEYDVSTLKDGNHKVKIKVIEKGTSKVLSEESHNFKLTKSKTTQYMDFPKTEVDGKKIVISGWAMSTEENDVLIYVDENQVNNIIRTERNDVLEAVKDSGNKETTPLPGYRAEYNASALKDGEHKITIKIVEKETDNVLSEESHNFKLTKYKTNQYLDFPKSEIKGNQIIISGWAMSTTENNVLVYIDENQIDNVIRTERNDVLKAVKGYGNKETTPLPGYRAEYNASALKDGEHKITIKIVEKETDNILLEESQNFKLTKYIATQNIDFPKIEETGSNINIKGWFLSNDQNSDVEIYIDEQKVDGIEREKREELLDIVKGYGDETTNPLPSYKGVYDASALKDGTHKITVKVIDKLTNEVLSESSNSFKLTKYIATQNIDFPKIESQGTSINIKGWFLSNDYNSDIIVYIDEQKVDGIEREKREGLLDIVKGYGDETTNPLPSYKGIYDATTLKDGTHKITVQVIDKITNEILSTNSKDFTLIKCKGIIYIDSPTFSMFSKNVTFKGWEMSDAKDSMIKVYIDDKFYDIRTKRITRDDVLANVTGYGDKENNLTPGFETSIDLNILNDGKHKIELKLYSKYDDILATYTKEIFVYNSLYMGIDVSQWNGNVDWNSVKPNGIEFAMIRLGYRGYGDSGTLRTDSQFITNINNANNVGIKTGVYFFSQAKDYNEGVEEANYVINTINDNNLRGKIRLPIAFDTEYSTEPSHNGRADHISRENRTLAALGFLRTISTAGYTPMIYASKSWFSDKLDMLLLNQYEVWLAHYTKSIAIPSDYSGIYQMWQYTSEGTIGGINGDVDLNVSYKNY